MQKDSKLEFFLSRDEILSLSQKVRNINTPCQTEKSETFEFNVWVIRLESDTKCNCIFLPKVTQLVA